MGIIGKAFNMSLGLGLKAGFAVTKAVGRDAIRSTATAARTAGMIGAVTAKTAHKGLATVGRTGIDFFGGAGTVAARSLRDPESRQLLAETHHKIAKSIGTSFVKRAEDSPIGLTLTVPGIVLLGAAKTFDNSRDIYTQEKARRMGTVENKPVSLTPNMSIPQYEFNPKKRMGALDGGASGSLVFALHNNR